MNHDTQVTGTPINKVGDGSSKVNTNSPTSGLYYKLFAAPGIDSQITEQGLISSGAGLHPDTVTEKASPTDWQNESPSQGYATDRFIGNFAATQAPNPTSLRVRRRGLSPFGGTFPGKSGTLAYQHPGGISDMNPGASSLIAGTGNSTPPICRVNTHNPKTRGMRLPVLPTQIVRGGQGVMPTGGGSHEPLTAPLQPRVSGWASIFSFRSNKAVAK
jgi:hypothetical protein